MQDVIINIFLDGTKYYYLGSEDGVVYLDTSKKNALIIKSVTVVEHYSIIREFFKKNNKEVKLSTTKVK